MVLVILMDIIRYYKGDLMNLMVISWWFHGIHWNSIVILCINISIYNIIYYDIYLYYIYIYVYIYYIYIKYTPTKTI